MKTTKIPLLLSVALSAMAAAPAWANDAAEDESGATRRDIVVTANRVEDQPNAATGLPLTIVDTPQSVTVLDNDFLSDFSIDDTNDALRLITGLNVESVETDRTYFTARGFDIKAIRIDGVGFPSDFGGQNGQLDSAVFDKIEVVRGANGLLTGIGNPSATINYIRKRPKGQRALSTELTVGSWNKVRAEADLELPISDAGQWSIRAVGAVQDSDSYLRDYENRRAVGQAILSGGLTDSIGVVFGYTRQDGSADSPLWGALPVLNTDGTPAVYPRSTSISQKWAYWDTHDTSIFGEVYVNLANNWTLTTTLTRKIYDEESRLFYAYGTPDAITGLGLFGFPGRYDQKFRGWVWDAELVGDLSVGGRDLDVTLGSQYSKSELGYLSYPVPFTDPAWGALPALPDWDGFEVPTPAFGEAEESADVDTRLWRAYGAARLSVTDQLKVIGGFNYIDTKVVGSSFGTDYGRDESKLSPYAGVTFAIAPSVNLYASYSDVFEPQKELGVDLQPIGPAKGTSVEGGVKGNFLNGGLFASFAVYSARQSNIPEAVGFDPTTGTTTYRGITANSKGVEFEVGGRLAETLSLQGGVSHIFELENDSGARVRTYTPTTTANLAVRWQPVKALTLGAAARWQDDIYLVTADGTARQNSYATLQIFGAFDIADHVSLKVNVNNVTDVKYYSSLYWAQAFYAAPRNVSVSVGWQF